MRVAFKKVKPNAIVPKYATIGSAGLDLHACIESPVYVAPGETVMIPTGLALDLKNPNVACMLLPRSGLGSKSGIVLGNLVGLCDSDYQGEYILAVWNRNKSGDSFEIKPNDRVAQAVFVPVIQVELVEVDEFESATERGAGGFGSTKVAHG